MHREYIFDLVLNQVSLKDETLDKSLLAVVLKFRGQDYEITSSRIDVTDFKEGRSIEFEVDNEELPIELSENPLHFTLKIGDTIIGETTLEFPPALVDIAGNEDFVTFSHLEEREILLKDSVVGSVIIAFKIDCKCKLIEEDCYECDNLGDDENLPLNCAKDIDPNDVLFVIGDNTAADCYGKNVLTQCGESPCQVSLDLSKYKVVRGKLIKSPDILNTCGNFDCCELKNEPTDLCQLLDTFGIKCCEDRKKEKKLSPRPCLSNRPKCQKSNDKAGRACQADKHICSCPHEDKFSDMTSGESLGEICKECAREARAKAGARDWSVSDDCPSGNSMMNLKEDLVIRPKNCPICYSDISWLPKFAACPKCGYKPVPYSVEQNYNEEMTADEILAEWADKPDVEKQKQCPDACPSVPPNRCKCDNGRICAFCRIKSMCSEILGKHGKKPPKNRPECEEKPLPSFAICEDSDNEDQRPHLARCISELRDLYDIEPDESKKPKLTPQEQKCKMLMEAFDKTDTRKKSPKLSKEAKCLCESNNPLFEARPKVKKSRTTCDPCGKTKKCGGQRKKNRNYSFKIPKHEPLKKPSSMHTKCQHMGKSVPANMGWLWNINLTGPRKGWKPGAIRKPIKEIMNYFLVDFPVDTIPVTKYTKHRKQKKMLEEEGVVIQKPTLRIQKRNGEYLITMRPLKDATQLKVCEDPYVKMKPIQFKIAKCEIVVQKREAKRILRERGFKKCICHKPIKCCCCRPFIEKKQLEYAVRKLSCKMGIDNLADSLVLSDTTDSDSELDIEFTPPAGMVKPALRRKPDVVAAETQYIEADYNTRPIFTPPLNKYMKPFDCANRYNDVPGIGGMFGPDGPPGIKGGKGAGGRARGGPGGRDGRNKGGQYSGRSGRGGRGGRGGPGGASGRGGGADGKGGKTLGPLPGTEGRGFGGGGGGRFGGASTTCQQCQGVCMPCSGPCYPCGPCQPQGTCPPTSYPPCGLPVVAGLCRPY